jgi:hypothetical protein
MHSDVFFSMYKMVIAKLIFVFHKDTFFNSNVSREIGWLLTA